MTAPTGGHQGRMDHPAAPPYVPGSDRRTVALEDAVRELRRDLDTAQGKVRTLTEELLDMGARVARQERDLTRLSVGTLEALQNALGALRELQAGVDAAMASAHRHHPEEGP